MTARRQAVVVLRVLLGTRTEEQFDDLRVIAVGRPDEGRHARVVADFELCAVAEKRLDDVGLSGLGGDRERGLAAVAFATSSLRRLRERR